eukprot:7821251-Prorocentrum_lima.AAC.1
MLDRMQRARPPAAKQELALRRDKNMAEHAALPGCWSSTMTRRRCCSSSGTVPPPAHHLAGPPARP